MGTAMFVRVEQLRDAIKAAIQEEPTIETTPWVTRISLPAPPPKHPDWPALIAALRGCGGRWGNITTMDGSHIWIQLTEDDDV